MKTTEELFDHIINDTSDSLSSIRDIQVSTILKLMHKIIKLNDKKFSLIEGCLKDMLISLNSLSETSDQTIEVLEHTRSSVSCIIKGCEILDKDISNLKTKINN